MLRGTALGILGAALPATETIMASPARADAAPLTLTVNAAQPGHAVSPDLFGAFFEEINSTAAARLPTCNCRRASSPG